MNFKIHKATEILKILNEYGEAFICGGAVRDFYLNCECDDVDICTNVPMEKIESIFKCHDIGKNKDFGIVIIEYLSENFEIAQFRTDGNYSDGRHPDSVEFTSSVIDDVKRRDFTINGLLMDKNVKIIDYVEGISDIKNGVLRTIGNPEDRFNEDFLRMLRAVRFASCFNFKIDEKTKIAIIKNAHNIVKISPERIFKELWKMAKSINFASSIQLLKEVDLLKWILPEIYNLIGLEQNLEYHSEGDCYNHTIQALRLCTIPNPYINFSILFHDIGKFKATKVVNDKIIAHGHDLDGYNMIDEIAKRMKFPNELTDIVKFCTLNHMKMHNFDKMKPYKIKELVEHKYWWGLSLMSFCDIHSTGRIAAENEWKIIKKKEQIANSTISILELRKIINGDRVLKVCPDAKGKNIGFKINKTIEWIVNKSIDVNNVDLINKHIKSLKLDNNEKL